MTPDGGAGFSVAKLEFQGKACGHRRAADFLEVVETAAQEVITADAAALGVDGAIAARGTQSAEENVLNHFGGRFGPALIFVGAHILAVGTVDDAIFAIQM